ncbi:hypothetical protein ACJX0J_021026 [Zea mays]
MAKLIFVLRKIFIGSLNGTAFIPNNLHRKSVPEREVNQPHMILRAIMLATSHSVFIYKETIEHKKKERQYHKMFKGKTNLEKKCLAKNNNYILQNDIPSENCFFMWIKANYTCFDNYKTTRKYMLGNIKGLFIYNIFVVKNFQTWIQHPAMLKSAQQHFYLEEGMFKLDKI